MSATLTEHPTTAAEPSAGRRALVLAPVDWNTYSKFARLFEAHPGHRLAYDHGVLEIMAPSMGHEGDSRFLGDLAFLGSSSTRGRRTMRTPWSSRFRSGFANALPTGNDSSADRKENQE